MTPSKINTILRKAVSAWIKLKVVMIILYPANLVGQSAGSTIINGSFENNTLSTDAINNNSVEFDSLMPNCYSIGSYGNIDIIKSDFYCDAVADDGQWFIALTGGGTDILSLSLSNPIAPGKAYSVTFSDKFCQIASDVVSSDVEIGLSNEPESFGTLIYIARAPLYNDWLTNTFTFNAPIEGKYLTVRLSTGTCGDTWVQFDNFSIGTPTSLDDYADASSVSVYPNPASENVTVTSTDVISGMKLYSPNGTLLYDIKPQDEARVLDANISDLAAGMYILEIQEGDSRTIRKIMKTVSD